MAPLLCRLFCAALFFHAVTVNCSVFSTKIVQVVHRHGARMPELLTNRSLLCPDSSLPCGALTNEGKLMLESLGGYMRTTYPTLFSGQYNPYTTYTRSTNLQRTLQSADSFLRGAFPNLTTFFPVIQTVPIAEDYMLDPYDSWPAAQIRAAGSWSSDVESNLLAYATTMGLTTDDVLLGFQRETMQYVLCPTYVLYCLLSAQDLVESLYSRGLLVNSSYPYLTAWMDPLNSLLGRYNALRFFYNSSDPFSRGMGALGLTLVTDMMQNIKSPQVHEAAVSLTTEYSAHDTTLVQLYTTLGATSFTRPVFAEAFVLEANTVDDNASDTTVYVRAFRGSPGQLPGNHTYSFAAFPLLCMTSGGTVYNQPGPSAPAAGCPIEDFIRFVQQMAPTSPINGGMCFNYPPYQQQACPSGSVPPDPQTQSTCINFRSICPLSACRPGETVDANLGYSCVEVVDTVAPGSTFAPTTSTPTTLSPLTSSPSTITTAPASTTAVPCTPEPPASSRSLVLKIMIAVGSGVGTVIGLGIGCALGRRRKQGADSDRMLN